MYLIVQYKCNVVKPQTNNVFTILWVTGSPSSLVVLKMISDMNRCRKLRAVLFPFVIFWYF